MSETEHEHDGDGEDVTAPVSPETAVDDEQADEDEREHEQAQEEPAEASAPQSEKQIEQALKRVEKAGTTYRNAVSRAMGEDAQALQPCPRCNAPVAGMVFPPDVAPVDDETREAVLVSLGMGESGPARLNAAKGVRECDVCDGYGMLAYPGKVPHVQEQNCPKCHAQGYVTDEPANVTPIASTSGPVSFTQPTAAVAPPCPLCGAPDSLGKPHYCNPVAASG